jgi:hypothetical protein
MAVAAPSGQQGRARANLVFTKNDLRVLDGPFVESKDLIGGFAVLERSDMDEAIAPCHC